MSYLKRLAILKEQEKATNNKLNSANKVLLYGNGGKSTIAAAFSMDKKRPVYILSPAGGSSYLEAYFPNIITENLNGLAHLNDIIEQLEAEYDDILYLKATLDEGNKDRIDKAREHYRNFYIDDETTIDIWDRMHDAAIANELPFSAIVLEELNIISNMIYDEIQTELELDKAVGSDPSVRGKDWSLLSKRVLNLYTRLLKLPTTIIFCTGDRIPKEQQDGNQIIPDVTVGSANRKIIQMIGNVFYCNINKKTGEHEIQIVEDKAIFCKEKISSPFSKMQIDKVVNVEGKPQYFWEYLNTIAKDGQKTNKKDSNF